MTQPPLVCDPHAIDAAWLTAAVHARGVATGARVVGVERKFVGTGQMGRNVRFSLTWEGDAEGAPVTLVGKFPSDDPTSRGTGASQGAYRKEIQFYQEIVDTVDIRTPRCWLAAINDEYDGEFVLLMEDVAPAEQGDQIAGCNVDEAAVALDELAKLHAPRWGDASLADHAFLGGPDPEQAKLLEVMWGMLWPGFEQRYADHLAPEAIALGARFGGLIAMWTRPRETPLTVAHGDYRLDNMLFGRGGDSPPLAVVDWQTVARGVGTADAAYFLGAGLPIDTRRKEEEALVRRYWDALCARGVSGYGWDDCWRDYRHYTFSGVVMAVVASMIVEQTERGDEMFMAMMSRHSQHALDLDAEALLG